MIKKNAFLILYIILGLSYLHAQDWIGKSINLTINTKFSEAESLLIHRIHNDSSIVDYFYYASVLNSKMVHFENNYDETDFLKAINNVIEIGTKSIELGTGTLKEKAKTLFYVGSAYGSLAYYQGRKGEWFPAVNNGRKAQEFLTKAVETDSTLWDAYLGLGSYKYWLSTKVYWIPFIDDEREEGISLIKKTIKHDSFSKSLAMHQLVYILLDYGDFKQAQKIAEELIVMYPQSQFVYWAYAHVFMKKKEFEKAIAAYQKLLQLIHSDPNANPNHKITCLARMMDMYARAGNCLQAGKTKQRILKDPYYAPIRNNQEAENLIERESKLCRDSD